MVIGGYFLGDSSLNSGGDLGDDALASRRQFDEDEDAKS